MAELESGCPVCHKERVAQGETDLTFGTGLCLACFGEFVNDCADGWVGRKAYANEVVDGWRRVELAYYREYDYGGPPDCDRCGDENGWTSGCAGEIVFPDGDRVDVCWGCEDDFQRESDVGTGDLMSPVAAAQFQRRGVESYRERAMRESRRRRAVEEKQGGLCADCGEKPDAPGSLAAWPDADRDDFVMVCYPCHANREAEEIPAGAGE